MSQFSSPGLQIQHVGSDYTGTNGLLVPASGGVAAKAVPFSELQSAVQTLETAYGVADNVLSTSINQVQAALSQSISTGDAALGTRIDGLNLLTEAQVATLIAAAVAGGVRYKGTAAAGAATPTAALGTSTYAQGDLYRVASSGTSAFGVALSSGDYVLYNGTGWDKIDSTDPSLSAGDSVVVVQQVGDNQYSVTIAPAFIARVTSLETNLAAETTARTSAVSTINTALALKASQAALDSAIATLNTADTGLQTAITAEASTRATDISGLQSRATSIETVNTNQDAALASEVTARTSADSAEVANRLAGDATLQSAVDAEVTARAAADSTLTTNLAAEATARTGADSTLTTNLAAEVTSRTNADATIQTSLTDARATIVTHGTNILALQSTKIDRTIATSAISQSILLLKKFETLTNGVYDMVNRLTRFYIPGFSASATDWQAFLPHETAAPYENSSSPQFRYYTYANLPAGAPSGLDSSKSYAEVTFHNSLTQIPNGSLRVLCEWVPDLAAMNAIVNGFTTPILPRDITLFNALTYSATNINSMGYNYHNTPYTMAALYDGSLTNGMMVTNSSKVFVHVSMSVQSYLNRLNFYGGQFNGAYNSPNTIKIYRGTVSLDTAAPLYEQSIQPTLGLQQIDLTGVMALNSSVTDLTIVFGGSGGNLSVMETELSGHVA